MLITGQKANHKLSHFCWHLELCQKTTQSFFSVTQSADSCLKRCPVNGITGHLNHIWGQQQIHSSTLQHCNWLRKHKHIYTGSATSYKKWKRNVIKALMLMPKTTIHNRPQVCVVICMRLFSGVTLNCNINQWWWIDFEHYDFVCFIFRWEGETLHQLCGLQWVFRTFIHSDTHYLCMYWTFSC